MWGSKSGASFDIEEIRLVADLRIMHAKVNELSHIVNFLRQRHSEQDIVAYADSALLASDIEQVDDLYLWFVKVKEERDRGIANR